VGAYPSGALECTPLGYTILLFFSKVCLVSKGSPNRNAPAYYNATRITWQRALQL